MMTCITKIVLQAGENQGGKKRSNRKRKLHKRPSADYDLSQPAKIKKVHTSKNRYFTTVLSPYSPKASRPRMMVQ